jgi:K+-transporting ATPase ATPase A chain
VAQARGETVIPSVIQYAVFIGIVLLLVQPVGSYVARVFTGERTSLDRALLPVERALQRLFGVDSAPMTWGAYAGAFTLFTLAGTVVLLAMLCLQSWLPGPPSTDQLTTPMPADLALNTAISFSTTTTWQAYSGETTLRYWTQLAGLTAQNFMAGAAGLAVGIAFIRGVSRERSDDLGNFWRDLIRGLLWILLPVSTLGSLVLVWRGVPLNFRPYTAVTTLEGMKQVIAQGPVAALEFIKNLGTNGGGFFNANGAHPFESPSGATNFLEMLAIVVLPAALTGTFGRMVDRPRVGWMLLGVMLVLFVGGILICDRAERSSAPALVHAGLYSPNLEGKEVRFGAGGSVLAAVVTSNAATGSYAAMHDSFMPVSVLVLSLNMLMGEIVFGGLGTGLYSILLVALVALFLGGLMTGRTPEFLGKTLGPPEMKLVTIYSLVTPLVVMTLTALAIATSVGRAGLTTNSGPHGLSEILFAYASCAANNGQTLAGLSANSWFYNATTAVAMLAGRLGLAVPALALAGLFGRQGRRPDSKGTLPMDTVLFGILTIGTAFFLAGLSFFPALAVGPIVEHFQIGGMR